MRKDQLAFLAAGLVFGLLFGFGAFHAWSTRPGGSPGAEASVATGPMGPSAMSGVPPQAPAAAPPAGGAPMVGLINELKSRLQADPKDLEAATGLAHLYHDAGMFGQAIPFYERAVELSSKDPNLLTDLGICLQEVGRLDDSLEAFARASAADPAHWQSLYNTVIVAMKDGRVDRAGEALERLETVNPQAPNLGELKDAVERMRRVGTGREAKS